ncbi:hypothetical protein [Micromonospora chersina]|uniref:hypothetical protein n=1 Tax=Micromonospora chersina TaxID=47854 RepID=UPI00371D5B87
MPGVGPAVLPPYALPPEPADVLPAYLVLVGLALVALVRSGSVPVALGLAAAIVLAGCRWAEQVRRRAHGAARPGS